MKNWMQVLALTIVSTLLMSCGGTKNLRIAKYDSKKTRTTRSAPKSEAYATNHRTTVNNNTAESNVIASTKREAIVNTAKQYLSIPYKYGGKTPNGGFDCSGFTSYVYKRNGVPIDGPSYQQAKKGKKKDIKSVEQGDLVVFGHGNKVSHVAIVAYRDSNSLKVVHSTSSRGVVVDEIIGSSYWEERFLYAKDVLN